MQVYNHAFGESLAVLLNCLGEADHIPCKTLVTQQVNAGSQEL